MTELSDKQDEVTAQVAIIRAANELLQPLRIELAALEAQDLDDRDAEVAGRVTAIDNANGAAKATLIAELNARVLAGIVEAGDDEVKRGRARGRANAALAAGGVGVQPLSAGLPGRGNGRGGR